MLKTYRNKLLVCIAIHSSFDVFRQDFEQAQKDQDFSYIQEMLVSTFKSSRDINLTFKVCTQNQNVVKFVVVALLSKMVHQGVGSLCKYYSWPPQ